MPNVPEQTITGGTAKSSWLTDAAGFAIDGTNTTPVAASVSTDTVIKGGPGRLCRILVTVLGTNAMLIFDNASGHTGTAIGAVPASAAVGTLIQCQAPAALGITIQGNAANPAVTVIWS